MDVKRSVTYRMLVVGLFSALLLVPGALKSVHMHHHAGDCCAEDEQHAAHHDCDNCPVCHFTLSLFVEAEPFDILFLPACYSLEPSSGRKKIYLSPFFPCYLRGPPVA
ncbi:MAG: hypothetical protein LBQ39_06060 [Tannerellaceae bacterium]|nr:hypothetical protein [Tannerellaceae bacterium]